MEILRKIILSLKRENFIVWNNDLLPSGSLSLRSEQDAKYDPFSTITWNDSTEERWNILKHRMCCSMTEKSYKNGIETKQKNLLKQAKFREV